ncbi:MAG TPA: OmpA family protein [Chthoniobacteraceae bacterium]|jgi:outer membrane protein OmpA-like peptidoglycan-associated protein|nr:OmpA family protein [Chthoniobacteraceae bacterium]
MKTHTLRTTLSLAIGAALAVTAPAQTSTKEKELQTKEIQLQKKEADLDRQRADLDAARKQLKVEETAQRVTMRLEGDALFDSGKALLRPEAETALAKIGVVLSQFPTAGVLIEGHTDSKGKPSVNLDLSEKRAVAVREYLKKRADLSGINFTTRGLGETKPISPNETEEGRQQNRRVEIVVEKMK